MSRMKEVIEQIKVSTSLFDTINEYVQLSKVGRNYRGLCPFHNEKSPSFFMNEGKGVWKCFGCGKSGDVINFFAEINNYTNSQAIKVLSNREGLNNTGKYRKKVEELAKKRAESLENQRKFKEALKMLENELQKMITFCRYLISNIKTERDLDTFGFVYHELVHFEELQDDYYNMSNEDDENEMYMRLKEFYLFYKPFTRAIFKAEGDLYE